MYFDVVLKSSSLLQTPAQEGVVPVALGKQTRLSLLMNTRRYSKKEMKRKRSSINSNSSRKVGFNFHFSVDNNPKCWSHELSWTWVTHTWIPCESLTLNEVFWTFDKFYCNRPPCCKLCWAFIMAKRRCRCGTTFAALNLYFLKIAQKFNYSSTFTPISSLVHPLGLPEK